MADNDDLSRVITVTSAYGDANFLFRSMVADEELSRLFRYDIEVLSENHAIEFDKILGHDMTVRVETTGKDDRYFHGFVSDIAYAGDVGKYACYRATLRPWLWFLTRTSDCRIFYKEEASKTVPEIVMEVFEGHGFDSYVKNALNQTDYKKWEYCVQYRETDFNFVCRLLEQEGIYFYFAHEDGKHTMVLTDGYNGHDVVSGYEEIPYMLPTSSTDFHHDCISGWQVRQSVQPGIYAINDFDFEKPKTGLEAKHVIERAHGHADYEMYDYPGEYISPSDGDAYVRARLEESQCEFERVVGQGNSRGITVGSLFNLTDCARDDQNREYLVVKSVCEMNDTAYESGAAAEGTGFAVRFEAIDASHQYRPKRTTPKPIVQGPQTAIVVGKGGEEVWTDKYGRVKVQFHWDREGGADENSSCWIRVAQVWAGKKWGAMYIPRIGQEVIVDFLEGDPDKPIVTGRVYNGDAMPPYALPANKTMSTLKSNSSKGGEGFNELRFEDKKGEEQIFLHGEKNYDIRIKNDRYETILHDRHLKVENDKIEHVKHNRNERVNADHMEEIGKDRHVAVKGKQAVKVDETLSVTVGKDVAEVFKANHSEQVTDDYFLKATNIVIEAGTNITLKVGQSFVAIESGGITIGTTGDIELDAKGNVTINAAMNANTKGAAGAKLEGAMVDVKADGVCNVKGAMVNIN